MAKKALVEMLRGASEDVQKTTASVVAAMREQQHDTPSEYGEQVAASIRHYGESVAEFIRAIGEQAKTTADSYASESNALSDNILRAAELEAERCLNFTHRMRDLGKAMQAAKSNFESAIGHSVNGRTDGKVDVDLPALASAISDQEA